MQSALERRQAIVDVMIERRKDTIPNLAHEFNVAPATIRRDLNVISKSYPIISVPGRSGGVFYLGKETYKKCPLSVQELIFLHELRHTISREDSRELEKILHKLMVSWASK